MKRLVFVFVFLLAAPTAFAQNVEPDEIDASPRIGVGTEIQLALFNSPTGVLAVPIEWNAFRLEPSIGGSYRLSELDQTSCDGDDCSTTTVETTQSELQLGIAAHLIPHRDKHTTFYLGLEAFGTRSKVSLPDDTGLNGGTTWGIKGGPVIGASYLATKNLSFGLEVGVVGEFALRKSDSAGLGGLGELGLRSNSGFRIRYLF